MGVCSFYYKFQYVLVGWEGSVADSHILASALSRSNPLVVPLGMSSHFVNGYMVSFRRNEVMIIKIT